MIKRRSPRDRFWANEYNPILLGISTFKKLCNVFCFDFLLLVRFLTIYVLAN